MQNDSQLYFIRFSVFVETREILQKLHSYKTILGKFENYDLKEHVLFLAMSLDDRHSCYNKSMHGIGIGYRTLANLILPNLVAVRPSPGDVKTNEGFCILYII